MFDRFLFGRAIPRLGPQNNLVSCRERWTLFNGNYLSGAILMAADNVGPLESIMRSLTCMLLHGNLSRKALFPYCEQLSFLSF